MFFSLCLVLHSLPKLNPAQSLIPLCVTLSPSFVLFSLKLNHSVGMTVQQKCCQLPNLYKFMSSQTIKQQTTVKACFVMNYLTV